ncbi:MAG: Co2+/Mg2+ efflux protein ApaG [Deltaproteobacteria bacterium]|nr:Co2+/Mg2+ efflux protein ApaG [Deltaproteobacteria bacterium]
MSKNDIEVKVAPQYLAARSKPGLGLYVYSYTVTITNHGELACQLLGRHWIITDAGGEEEKVSGPGVVGEQPVLEPGESFAYTSSCPLHTAMGAMKGSYQMVNSEGEAFLADIPAFVLVQASEVN